MTTLMTVGNSEGTRRCDAKCYDAKGGSCDCICNGKNHGQGFARAQKNVQEMFEPIVKAAIARQHRESGQSALF